MKESLFRSAKKTIPYSSNIQDVVEVRIFQNSNNKQFNLPVLKKHISPKVMNDIFNNKNIIGLKFKVTDLIFKNNHKGVPSKMVQPFRMKGVPHKSVFDRNDKVEMVQHF